jgi:esterase/lipase superfamily enzyme
MQQYFIKISPKINLVNVGKLAINSSNTSLQNYIKNQEVDILSIDEALIWLDNQCQTNEKNKVIFYIHGFWASIPFALHRTAKAFQNHYFKNDNTSIKAIVHIIWQASGISYAESLSSISSSHQKLAEILFKIPRYLSSRLGLLVHSMGNQLLYASLKNNTFLIPFQEVILVAPDLDYAVFEKDFKQYFSLSNQLYVFIHKKDKTLGFSKQLNKIERLGRVDLAYLDQKKIVFIDNTNINDIENLSDKIMKHLYFIYSLSVRKQIIRIFDHS